MQWVLLWVILRIGYEYRDIKRGVEGRRDFLFSFFFFLLILFGVGAYLMSSWTQNKTCTIACKVGHSRSSLRFFSPYTVIFLMLRV